MEKAHTLLPLKKRAKGEGLILMATLFFLRVALRRAGRSVLTRMMVDRVLPPLLFPSVATSRRVRQLRFDMQDNVLYAVTSNESVSR